jgi:TrmH family RNA methyltransferase
MKKFDITSLQNPHVKYVVKLRLDRRQRQRDRLMLVEGWDEINLALSAGYDPRKVFTAPEIAVRQFERIISETYTVTRAVFEKISYRENPDGWMAVFPIPEISLDKLKLSDVPLVIAAESLEKPGNLGAILRTADAAAVDALLVCDPLLDVWNPNVVRASRGALFTVPVVETDNAKALSWLRSIGFQIVATAPSAKKSYTQINLCSPTVLVVGTENKGLTNFWMTNADERIMIPMQGKVNSLNVSIATALILYEAIRQRGTKYP